MPIFKTRKLRCREAVISLKSNNKEYPLTPNPGIYIKPRWVASVDEMFLDKLVFTIFAPPHLPFSLTLHIYSCFQHGHVNKLFMACINDRL